jgi:hypothetical protein
LGVVDGALQLATYDQVIVCRVCRVWPRSFPAVLIVRPLFAAVAQMKYRLTDDRGVFPAWAQLLAGAGSRALALVATYPYQLLRSVLQQQNCPYSGVLHATRHVLPPPRSPLSFFFVLSSWLLMMTVTMTVTRRS